MKRYLILLLVGLFAAGCDYKGKPVEYSGICNKENDKEYIEVVGFFKNNGSAMCSKRGNEPMRCPVDFVDTPDQAFEVVLVLEHEGKILVFLRVEDHLGERQNEIHGLAGDAVQRMQGFQHQNAGGAESAFDDEAGHALDHLLRFFLADNGLDLSVFLVHITRPGWR